MTIFDMRQAQARAARRQVEEALGNFRGPFHPGLSRWLDMLLVIEEAA